MITNIIRKTGRALAVALAFASSTAWAAYQDFADNGMTAASGFSGGSVSGKSLTVTDASKLDYVPGGSNDSLNRKNRGWYAGATIRWPEGGARDEDASMQTSRMASSVSGESDLSGTTLTFTTEKARMQTCMATTTWWGYITPEEAYAKKTGNFETTLTMSGKHYSVTTLGVNPATFTINFPVDSLVLKDDAGVQWFPVVATNGTTGKVYGDLDVALDAGGEVVVVAGTTITNKHTLGSGVIFRKNGNSVSGLGKLTLVGGSYDFNPNTNPCELGVGCEVSYNMATQLYDVKPHTHNWTFSKDGDTVTATCSAGSGCAFSPQTLTIKINETSKTYDGTKLTTSLIYNTSEAEFKEQTGATVGPVYWAGRSDGKNDGMSAGEQNAQVQVSTVNSKYYRPKASLTIDPAPMSSATVTLTADEMNFAGKELTNGVDSVTAAGISESDWEVADKTALYKTGSGYSNETYTVTLQGKGNFTGTKEVTWTIKAPTRVPGDMGRGDFESGNKLYNDNYGECDQATRTLPVTWSTNIIFVAGHWYVGMTVDLPTDIDRLHPSESKLTRDEDLRVMVSTVPGRVFTGSEIYDGKSSQNAATEAGLCLWEGDDYLTHPADNDHGWAWWSGTGTFYYFRKIRWFTEVSPEKIEDAKLAGKSTLDFTLTVGGLTGKPKESSDYSWEGLKYTDYTIKVPVEGFTFLVGRNEFRTADVGDVAFNASRIRMQSDSVVTNEQKIAEGNIFTEEEWYGIVETKVSDTCWVYSMTRVEPAAYIQRGRREYYSKLSAAYAAAQDRETIHLYRDVNESLTNIAKSITLDLNGKTLTGADTSSASNVLAVAPYEFTGTFRLRNGKLGRGNLDFKSIAGTVSIKDVDIGDAAIRTWTTGGQVAVDVSTGVKSGSKWEFPADPARLTISGIGSLFKYNQKKFAGEGLTLAHNTNAATRAYTYIVVPTNTAGLVQLVKNGVGTDEYFLSGSDAMGFVGTEKGDTLKLVNGSYPADGFLFTDADLMKCLRFDLNGAETNQTKFVAVRHAELYAAKPDSKSDKIVFTRKDPVTRRLTFVVDGCGTAKVGDWPDGELKPVAHNQTGTESVMDYAEVTGGELYNLAGVPLPNAGHECVGWYTNTFEGTTVAEVLADPTKGKWVALTYDEQTTFAMPDFFDDLEDKAKKDDGYVVKVVFAPPSKRSKLTVVVEPAGAAKTLWLDDKALVSEDGGTTYVTNNVKKDAAIGHLLNLVPYSTTFTNVEWIVKGQSTVANPYAGLPVTEDDLVITAKVMTAAQLVVDGVPRGKKPYDGQPTNVVASVKNWLDAKCAYHFEYSENGTSWSENNPQKTNAGVYRVFVRLVDAYGVIHADEFTLITIDPVNAANGTPTWETFDYVYDGIAKTPAITKVTVPNGGELWPDKDFTTTYECNTNAGVNTAKAKVSFKRNAKGSATYTFTIAPRPITSATIDPVWNVANRKIDEFYPDVTEVRADKADSRVPKMTLTTDDYDIDYDNCAIAAGGQPRVIVTGKDNFCGSITNNFEILSKVKKEDNGGLYYANELKKDGAGVVPVVLATVDAGHDEYVVSNFVKDAVSYRVVGILPGAFTNSAPTLWNLKIAESDVALAGNIVWGLEKLRAIDFPGTTPADSPYYFHKFGDELGGAGVLVKSGDAAAPYGFETNLTLLGVADAADVFTVSNSIVRIEKTAFAGNAILKEIVLHNNIASNGLEVGLTDYLDVSKTVFAIYEEPSPDLKAAVAAIGLSWYKDGESRWITFDVATAEAKITSANGVVRYYQNITNAVADARNGETVVVLKDIEKDAAHTGLEMIRKRVLLNAQGHSILKQLPIDGKDGGSFGLLAGTYDWDYENNGVNYLVSGVFANPTFAWDGWKDGQGGVLTVVDESDIVAIYKDATPVHKYTNEVAAVEQSGAAAKIAGTPLRLYSTLANAVAGAKNLETVELLKKVEERVAVTAATTNVIDLCGNVWRKAPDFPAGLVVDAKGALITVTNGTVNARVRANKGKIVLNAITAKKDFVFDAKGGRIDVWGGNYALAGANDVTGLTVYFGTYGLDFDAKGCFDSQDGQYAFVRTGAQLWEVLSTNAVVAKVGDQDYADLSLAIELASEGATIELVKDVEETLMLNDEAILKQLVFTGKDHLKGDPKLAAERHDEFYTIKDMPGGGISLVHKDMPTKKLTFIIEGAGRAYVDGVDARHVKDGTQTVEDYSDIKQGSIVEIKGVPEVNGGDAFWRFEDANGERLYVNDTIDAYAYVKDTIKFQMPYEDTTIRLVFRPKAEVVSSIVAVATEPEAAVAKATLKLDTRKSLFNSFGNTNLFLVTKNGDHLLTATHRGEYAFCCWVTNGVVASTNPRWDGLQTVNGPVTEGIARFVPTNFTASVATNCIEKTYDGQGTNVTVIVGNGETDLPWTVEYSVDGGANWTTKNPSFTNVCDEIVGWRVRYGAPAATVAEGTVEIVITEKDITEPDVEVVFYDLGMPETVPATQLKPALDVVYHTAYGDLVLVEGVDYTLSYGPNQSFGKGKVTVYATDENFTGDRTEDFSILKVYEQNKIVYYLEKAGKRAAVAGVLPDVSLTDGVLAVPASIKYTDNKTYTVVDIVPGAFTNVADRLIELNLKNCEKVNIWGNAIWGLEKLERIDFPGQTPADSPYYYSKLGAEYNGAGVLVKNLAEPVGGKYDWENNLKVKLLGVADAGDVFEVSNVVTKIARTAFAGNAVLKKIVLHNGIVEIEHGFTDYLDMKHVSFEMAEEPSDLIKRIFKAEGVEWFEKEDRTGWTTFAWEAAEAKIVTPTGEETYYTSFVDAVARARDGETVTVLKDLDGHGHDVTVPAGKQVIIDAEGKTLTNLSINPADVDAFGIAGGTFDFDYSAYLVATKRYAKPVMVKWFDENRTSTYSQGWMWTVTNSSAVVAEVRRTTTPVQRFLSVQAAFDSLRWIVDAHPETAGEFYGIDVIKAGAGAAYGLNLGRKQLNWPIFVKAAATNVVTNGKIYGDFVVVQGNEGEVTFGDGIDMTGDVPGEGGFKSPKAPGEGVRLWVTGGTYKFDPTPYCREGYTAAVQSDGFYHVHKLGDVQVTVTTGDHNVHYKTLQDAFDLAAAGSTIRLFNNGIVTAELKQDKNFTLTSDPNGQAQAGATSVTGGVITVSNGSLRIEDITFDKARIVGKAGASVVIGDKVTMTNATDGAISMATGSALFVDGNDIRIVGNLTAGKQKNVVLPNVNTLFLRKSGFKGTIGLTLPEALATKGQAFGTAENGVTYPDGDLSCAEIRFTNDRDGKLTSGMGDRLAKAGAKNYSRWVNGFGKVETEGDLLLSRKGDRLVWLAQQAKPAQTPDYRRIGATKNTLTVPVKKGQDYAAVAASKPSVTNWVSITDATVQTLEGKDVYTFENLPANDTYAVLTRRSITTEKTVSDITVELEYTAKYNAKQVAEWFDDSAADLHDEGQDTEWAENDVVKVSVNPDTREGYVVEIKKDTNRGAVIPEDAGVLKVSFGADGQNGPFILRGTATSGKGGDAIRFVKVANANTHFPADVTLVGSGVVSGAKGADGQAASGTTADGQNGFDGGDGITTEDGLVCGVTVRAVTGVEIYGGNGGKGGDAVGAKVGDSYTGAAGAGGNGGTAVSGDLTFTTDAKTGANKVVVVHGGNGGDGGSATHGAAGNGGNGGVAIAGTVTATVEAGDIRGGKGGNGGRSGYQWDGQQSLDAGNGGNGGNGGAALENRKNVTFVNGGDDGTDISVVGGEGGKGGYGKTSGTDGEAGISGKRGAPAATEITVVTGTSFVMKPQANVEYWLDKVSSEWLAPAGETYVFQGLTPNMQYTLKSRYVKVSALEPTSFVTEQKVVTKHYSLEDVAAMFDNKATVTVGEDGLYDIHLTDDITPGIELPNDMGEIELYTDGHSIVGADGVSPSQVGDAGKPAITFVDVVNLKTVGDRETKIAIRGLIGGKLSALIGGNGSTGWDDADNRAADGGNGGAAIVGCKYVTVTIDLGVAVSGGNGGDGRSSESGDAGNGGAGGAAVWVAPEDAADFELIVADDGCLYGGKGGNGGDSRIGTAGNGGAGGDGYVDDKGDEYGNGGDGGTGGNGGVADGAAGAGGRGTVPGIPGGEGDVVFCFSDGSQYFGTFTEAVEAAAKSATITVVRNAEIGEDEYPVIAKNLKLAIKPGVTLTCKSPIEIDEEYTVEVLSGTFATDADQASVFDVYGTLVVTGGEVRDITVYEGGALEVNGGIAGEISSEGGLVNVTGGRIEDFIYADDIANVRLAIGDGMRGPVFDFDPIDLLSDPLTSQQLANHDWIVVDNVELVAYVEDNGADRRYIVADELETVFADYADVGGEVTIGLRQDWTVDHVLIDQSVTSFTLEGETGRDIVVTDARTGTEAEIALFEPSKPLTIRNVAFVRGTAEDTAFLRIYEAKDVEMENAKVTGYTSLVRPLISQSSAGVAPVLKLSGVEIVDNTVYSAICIPGDNGFAMAVVLSGRNLIRGNGNADTVCNIQASTYFDKIVVAGNLEGEVGVTGGRAIATVGTQFGVADHNFGVGAVYTGLDCLKNDEGTRECGAWAADRQSVIWAFDPTQYAALVLDTTGTPVTTGVNGYFASIAEAYAAVKSGYTLVLTAPNQTISTKLESTKKFTLDGAGNRLTVACTDGLTFKSSTVTIKNVTLTAEEGFHALNVIGSANVTLEAGVKVENVTGAQAAVYVSGTKLTVKDGVCFSGNDVDFAGGGTFWVMGGKFAADPTAWVKDGYAAFPIVGQTPYNYEVRKTVASSVAGIVTAVTEVAGVPTIDLRKEVGNLRQNMTLTLDGADDLEGTLDVRTPYGWKVDQAPDGQGNLIVTISMDEDVLRPVWSTSDKTKHPLVTTTNPDGSVTQSITIGNAVEGFWYALLTSETIGGQVTVSTSQTPVQVPEDGVSPVHELTLTHTWPAGTSSAFLKVGVYDSKASIPK